MSELFLLNGELVRTYLGKEDRKKSYIAKNLGISDSLVDRMLAGYVPKDRTVKALASLIGVSITELLIPKAKETA